MSSSYTIVGCCDDKDLYFCRSMVQRFIAIRGDFVTFQFEAVLEMVYLKKLDEIKIALGGKAYSHTSSHYVLLNDEYFGDSSALLKYYRTFDEMVDIEADIIENLQFASSETSRCLSNIPAVFLAFSSLDTMENSKPRSFPKKLTIQLYTDICPIACDNFIKLCNGEMGTVPGTETKLHYLNCPVHRIVPGGWFQCGDIVDGSGANSMAAIGDDNKVHDENLSVDFSEKLGGIVGMSSSATHSNGSQFFVTLGPCPWMNHKFVGIGRVVRGFETLRKIEMEQTKNQKPVRKVFLNSCGTESHTPEFE